LRNQVLLKRESEQPVFSFKLRSPHNKIKMAQMAQDEAAAKVMTAVAYRI
jgi:threonine dehydratase